tara:strand:- start:334 stop:447 length:114 start_codon:yes stop_codon:yes gene_type:complete
MALLLAVLAVHRFIIWQLGTKKVLFSLVIAEQSPGLK